MPHVVGQEELLSLCLGALAASQTTELRGAAKSSLFRTLKTFCFCYGHCVLCVGGMGMDGHPKREGYYVYLFSIQIADQLGFLIPGYG